MALPEARVQEIRRRYDDVWRPRIEGHFNNAARMPDERIGHLGNIEREFRAMLKTEYNRAANPNMPEVDQRKGGDRRSQESQDARREAGVLTERRQAKSLTASPQFDAFFKTVDITFPKQLLRYRPRDVVLDESARGAVHTTLQNLLARAHELGLEARQAAGQSQ